LCKGYRLLVQRRHIYFADRSHILTAGGLLFPGQKYFRTSQCYCTVVAFRTAVESNEQRRTPFSRAGHNDSYGRLERPLGGIWHHVK
jgi:hypothetical protein